MSDRSKRPGPTGRFPQGKMHPSDEGELRIAITHKGGKVVIDFGKPTAWIGLDPERADALAELLKQHARQARS